MIWHTVAAWLIDAGFTVLRWVFTPIMWILAGTIGAWHHRRQVRGKG